MQRYLCLALLVVSSAAVDASAGKAEVAAKAAAVVKAGQAVKLPAGAAELKAKAAAALSNLPAAAAKAWEGGKGKAGFTPEQMTAAQAQAAQAFAALGADPKAAAAAASAGITPQKLAALQAQTAAAVAGFKSPEGKASVEAAGQQAREFMKSEPAVKIQEQAKQATAAVSADPQVKQALGQLKTEGKALAGKMNEARGNLPKLTSERGTEATPGFGLAVGAAGLKARAETALVKFCKKYEGKAELPARCRKAKPTR